MTATPVLTQERLKQSLTYDPETGLFTRNDSAGGEAKGSVAGGVLNTAYIAIRIDRRDYLAHRLAWLYMTGEWPISYIDHINRVPGDNRWENLRAASQTQQNANMGIRKDNTSGYRGVKWDKKRGKWSANIQVNGKQKHLGAFDDKQTAYASYVNAAHAAFGKFFVAQA